jgi:hypothetical protein
MAAGVGRCDEEEKGRCTRKLLLSCDLLANPGRQFDGLLFVAQFDFGQSKVSVPTYSDQPFRLIPISCSD